MTACAALSCAAAPGVHAQVPAPAATQAPAVGITLPGHVPALVNSSSLLGPVMGAQSVSLALTLPLRNQKDVATLIHNLYDANSSLQGQFLTPQQFTAQFGPTQADYNALTRWAQAHGLTVTGTNPSRTILDVSADAATVQSALSVHLLRYLDPTGRDFYAPDTNPTVDSSLAGVLSGVVGLDDAAVMQPSGAVESTESPSGGTGRLGFLAPSDIRTAYNLNNLSVNGAGQTLALFELDGYNQSDITAYENAYGLPNVPVQPVPVDQPNPDGAGAKTFEVAGDIELEIALAPGASRILVYEAAQGNPQTVIDEYSRIANDNLAKQISTSWGNPDTVNESYSVSYSNSTTSLVTAENTVFEQMAAQGQTIYVASGDNGAYDNGSSNGPMTHDPASQPYVCAVGGTSLTTSTPGGPWSAETTWNDNYGSGGGGISLEWPIPFYQSQSSVGSNAARNSIIYRNTPDVALNASGSQLYSVYYGGGFAGIYGTSFAAPLWAAFTALVNQQRAARSFNPVGLVNYYLYQIGTGLYGNYANDFHDIADNSNNYLYPAVSGYDLATGWGSFNGANLLADLAARGGAIPDTAPFYRISDPNNHGHLYSTDPGEWHNSVIVNHSNYEGVQCHVFYNAQDAPGLTPFYRTSNTAGDHLYTIYQDEYRNSIANGAHDEGIECYVFPNGNTPGSVPLWRTYSSMSGQHFYTTSQSEYNNSVSNKGTPDGVVCYVLP